MSAFNNSRMGTPPLGRSPRRRLGNRFGLDTLLTRVRTR
ncbi:hypothetical protein ABIE44_000523 [Marmoricola sp. OAE513]